MDQTPSSKAVDPHITGPRLPPPPLVDPWEVAYARFETPAQEIRKFARRLGKLGAANWSLEAEIVELFCGRGNGLHALCKLGFTRLAGIDLSSSLVAQYEGPAKLSVSDCRQLPFKNSSKDVMIVQGGLHHLKNLPQDLEQTLAEISRTLRDDGVLAVVEPWQTPFLAFVHLACRSKITRRILPKLDALAVMIDNERATYEQWLSQPEVIVQLFQQFFSTVLYSVQWGKCLYVGRKRTRSR